MPSRYLNKIWLIFNCSLITISLNCTSMEIQFSEIVIKLQQKTYFNAVFKGCQLSVFCSDPIMWGTYFTLWKQDNWLDISWLRMATRTIDDDYKISIQVATTCNMVHANLHTSSLCITTVHHNRLSLRTIKVYCQIIKLQWRQTQSMWSITNNLIIPRNIPFLDVLRPHIYLATRCYKCPTRM